MKKVISIIKNKRLKGNISLLVILILLASSVIALLSINQIQHLITYWNMTFNYFRAFYLAKAGTELWLSEVYYREAWFEHTINSGEAIVSKNLISEQYSGFNPYFTMNISWNFQNLTNDVRYTNDNDCTGNNKITLWTWEWIVLWLFKDDTNDIRAILTWTDESNIDKYDFIGNLKMENIAWENSDNREFTFWLFDYDDDWNMWNIFVETWSDLNSILDHISSFNKNERIYLSIKNPWSLDEVVSFCITTNNDKPIPYSDSLITVRWNYGDMEVWLQSVVKKTTPSWSLNVLWWQNPTI